MCFAGIEADMKELVQKVAARAGVKVVGARIDHGHLHLLVKDRGWVRSTDLLDEAEDIQDLTTRPAPRRLQRIPAYHSPGR